MFTPTPGNDSYTSLKFGANNGNTFAGGDGNDKLTVSTGFAPGQTTASYSNRLQGEADSDSLTLLATGGSGEKISMVDNSIEGGEGNNKLKLSIKQTKKDGLDIFAGNNELSGLSGKDRFDVNIQNKSLTDGSNFSGNTLSGGEGSNSFKVAVSAVSEYATIGLLESTSGASNDVFAITAKTTGEMATADINRSIIQAGDGADKITITAQASKADILIDDNEILAEGGNDLITLTAKAKTEAEIKENTLDAGDGDNAFKINVQSGDSVNFYENEILGGTGKDSIALNVKGKGSASETTVHTITINGGDGENSVNVKAQGKSDVTIEGSSLLGGSGTDKLQITAQTSSKTDTASIYQNSILLGEGENELKLQAKSGAIAKIEDSTVITGDEADEINFTSTGTTDARVDNNTLTTGGGDDSILLSSTARSGFASTSGNEVFALDGADTVEFKVSGNANLSLSGNRVDLGNTGTGLSQSLMLSGNSKGDISANANNLLGSAADIEISATGKNTSNISQNTITASTEAGGTGSEISLISTTTDSLSGGFSNQLYGSDYADVFTISSTSKKAQVISNNNSLYSGSGDDKIELALKAKTTVTANNNQLQGEAGSDYLLVDAKAGVASSPSGNTLDGGADDDVIALKLDLKQGDADVETLLSNNFIDGGTESDTLKFLDSKEMIDFTMIDDGQIDNIERIDIGKKNTVIFGYADIAEISSGTELFVTGTKGSIVDLSGSGLSQGLSISPNYDVFTYNGYDLFVSTNLTVIV